MQLFAPNRSYLTNVLLQVRKIKVTAQRGLNNSVDPSSEFHVNNDKWDEKG